MRGERIPRQICIHVHQVSNRGEEIKSTMNLTKWLERSLSMCIALFVQASASNYQFMRGIAMHAIHKIWQKNHRVESSNEIMEKTKRLCQLQKSLAMKHF